MKKIVQWIALGAAVLILFSLGLSRLEDGQHLEEKAILEDALRRTAVACYAAEGFYPPDVTYMQEHYGLQLNTNRFTVRYVLQASNLMPDITVLDKTP